jgi:hypothetical protein
MRRLNGRCIVFRAGSERVAGDHSGKLFIAQQALAAM